MLPMTLMFELVFAVIIGVRSGTVKTSWLIGEQLSLIATSDFKSVNRAERTMKTAARFLETSRP